MPSLLNPAKVLEKAVQKSITNGWNLFGFKDAQWNVGTRTGYKEAPVLYISSTMGNWDYRPTEVIFNQDFLKAFFGKDWQDHAKKMVIGNPLEYLAKHL